MTNIHVRVPFRLWDNVNEIQEVSNVTARHLEDIYEKDILKLQNFQSLAQHEIDKLREEVDSLMESVASGGAADGDGPDADQAEDVAKRLDTLEADMRTVQSEAGAAAASAAVVGEDLSRVYEDIDGLKEAREGLAKEVLILRRGLQKLDEQDLEDLTDLVERQELRLSGVEAFNEAQADKIERGGQYDHEKFQLVVAEIQTLKSQIYYLQQSVLQLRPRNVLHRTR